MEKDNRGVQKLEEVRSEPVFGQHLPPVPQCVAQTSSESGNSENPSAQWQNLVARWNAILVSEVTIDTCRQRMEGLRVEMEAATQKSLTTNEKLHALNSDVAQWNKAKNRLRYALPKAKEFIHRATWAMGVPERKKLEELFKIENQSNIPLLQLDRVLVEVEHLLKDRQILSAQGSTAYQECKNACSDCQGALRTLQSNATANEQKKRVAARAKNKSF